jgi:hypothetical protein
VGLNFVQIGRKEFSPGTLRRLDQKLGRLSGFTTIRYTAEGLRNEKSIRIPIIVFGVQCQNGFPLIPHANLTKPPGPLESQS